jgi:ketosteroid isomerase-like protein
MSQQNVELVRRSYETFQSGDIEAALQFFDPEGEFVSRFGAMEGRTYKGHNGIRQYLSDIDEAWESYDRELENLIDGGDRVLAVINIEAVSKGTGVRLQDRIGLGYWLRDGRIVRMVSYPSVDQALQAMGISG